MNTETTQNPDLTLPELIEQSFDFSVYGEEEKKAVIEETSGMIMESTMLRVLGDAPEEVQEKFGALVETEPSQEIMLDFVNTHFPDFNQVLVEEINVFKSMGEVSSEESESEKTA